jgi:branched-chain amino acid transport system substrate-binding protein
MKKNFSQFAIPWVAAFAILAGLGSPAFAKDNRPVKIGIMAPYVGVYTKLGRDLDNGFRFGLEEIGYQAGGRKIEIVTEDTEAKPELGPTKARKLIENEKVDLIAGIIHSGVALSIRDIVVNNKVPLVITNAGEPSLTGKLKSPYVFRVSFSNGQADMVGGWYAYNKLGYKRVILIAPDFSAGYQKADGFKKYFTASGGQIVDEIYAPLGTTDFGPYLTKVAAKAKSIDAVWMFFAGSGCIRLITQYQEYGLKGSVPLFVIGDTVDEVVLPSMKDAALGIKNYLHYSDMLNTPENQKFVKAYYAKYKDYPSIYAEQAYVGAKAIAMALNEIKGNIENKDAFLAAMRKVKFNAPRGPFSFDADQNAIIPVFIREVKKVDGRYANVVLETIPNVDQNWSPDKMKK